MFIPIVMTIRRSLLVFLSIALCVTVSSAKAQDNITIKIIDKAAESQPGSTTVRLWFYRVDASGAIVTGPLAPAESARLIVQQRDEINAKAAFPYPVTLKPSPSLAPVSVVFVVDIGLRFKATEADRKKFMADSLRELQVLQDKAGLIVLEGKVKVDQSLQDAPELNGSVLDNALKAHYTTADSRTIACTWDALYHGVELAQRSTNPALVIGITDGQNAPDRCLRTHSTNVRDFARKAGVPVFLIGAGSPKPQDLTDLQTLAQQTGGRYLGSLDNKGTAVQPLSGVLVPFRQMFVAEAQGIVQQGDWTVTLEMPPSRSVPLAVTLPAIQFVDSPSALAPTAAVALPTDVKQNSPASVAESPTRVSVETRSGEQTESPGPITATSRSPDPTQLAAITSNTGMFTPPVRASQTPAKAAAAVTGTKALGVVVMPSPAMSPTAVSSPSAVATASSPSPSASQEGINPIQILLAGGGIVILLSVLILVRARRKRQAPAHEAEPIILTLYFREREIGLFQVTPAELEAGITIGRSVNYKDSLKVSAVRQGDRIEIGVGEVSTNHLRLKYDQRQGAVTVSDLQSANGSQLNRNKRAHPLDKKPLRLETRDELILAPGQPNEVSIVYNGFTGTVVVSKGEQAEAPIYNRTFVMRDTEAEQESSLHESEHHTRIEPDEPVRVQPTLYEPENLPQPTIIDLERMYFTLHWKDAGKRKTFYLDETQPPITIGRDLEEHVSFSLRRDKADDRRDALSRRHLELEWSYTMQQPVFTIKNVSQAFPVTLQWDEQEIVLNPARGQIVEQHQLTANTTINLGAAYQIEFESPWVTVPAQQ